MPGESEEKARILVADDEAALRKALRVTLEDEGYDVFEAANGGAALNALRAQRADLIICDMFMPGMDGFETLRKLRREFPSVPVIAISGGGSHGGVDLDVLDMARHLGASEVLYKPLGRAALLAAVRALLLTDGMH